MMKKWQFAAVAALLVLASSFLPQGGGHLKIALEDRLDPNPRQMALGMQVAGMCVGLVVSWTGRMRGAGG